MSQKIASPRKARHRRWWLWTPLSLLLLVAVLVLSRTPAVPPNPAPTAAEVAAARGLYQGVRAAQSAGMPVPIATSWPDLAAAAKLGGRAFGVQRIALGHEHGSGWVMASVPLRLGFWVNLRARVRADSTGAMRISARIGRLPVPSLLAHGGIGLIRQMLRLRGAEIPPLDEMVTALRIDADGIAAQLALSGGSGIVSTFGGLRGGVDPALVATHYCRLVHQQGLAPSADLAEQVRRGFGESDGSSADNRAVFVALALLVARMDLGLLPEGPKPILARCGGPDTRFELLGRDDLAKHWTVSGALASVFGQQISISLGTWKEISDSGANGSGFSLIDLAADRSGTFCAAKAVDAETSTALRDWLRRAGQSDLLPVSALALAEGMSESQFRARYASTDSLEFEATVRRIDAQLAVLLRF